MIVRLALEHVTQCSGETIKRFGAAMALGCGVHDVIMVTVALM